MRPSPLGIFGNVRIYFFKFSIGKGARYLDFGHFFSIQVKLMCLWHSHLCKLRGIMVWGGVFILFFLMEDGRCHVKKRWVFIFYRRNGGAGLLLIDSPTRSGSVNVVTGGALWWVGLAIWCNWYFRLTSYRSIHGFLSNLLCLFGLNSLFL